MIFVKNKYFLSCLLFCASITQSAHAQKETFLHHFNWNQEVFSSAGGSARGFTINSLYRNYNDSINYFFSTSVPVAKFNSSFGVYYLQNTSGETQNIKSGLSYSAFIPFGNSSSLHAGIQGNRHQQAFSQDPWAFKEYRTDTSYYTYDLSLFLKRGKMSLGFSAENLLPGYSRSQTDYALLLGFHELRTNDWLRSSPYMLARLRHDYLVPEWRFNYTVTIVNTVMLGASYFKNSDYLYGFNAGFKLFNRVWLTAATDFVDTKLPYRAIYEFGLKVNISKKGAVAEKQLVPSPWHDDYYGEDHEEEAPVVEEAPGKESPKKGSTPAQETAPAQESNSKYEGF